MLCSGLTREKSLQLYREVLESHDGEAMRRLCREDLFFLLVVGCKRIDVNNDWIYARCREVEADPDGYLDLWAREHYKSTLITFGLTIRDILVNPEITVGIFSHTRPMAKSFLTQIKREFENNTFLQDLFPDVLYKNPQRDAPKWSLDDGIIVRRKNNPKESTIEAWGLVDGQPTSKHFSLLVYDDVVTQESVTTPEMIAKVTDAWSLSLNLGSQDGVKRHIGTRYHSNDTYKTIMDRGAAIKRLYPATDNGTLGGNPVFLSAHQLSKKIQDMGSYVAACQLLQNPLADNAMGLSSDWLMEYDLLKDTSGWNFYLLGDPANKKKKSSDYTVLVVIGLAPDNNYYLVDGVRDKYNLTQRTEKVFEFHRKWKPIKTGYEEYALSCDIEHIEFVQELENYRFVITPLGGPMGKHDRIRRLVPILEQHRFYIPHQLLFQGTDGKAHDFIDEFKRYEYTTFPVCTHDDMLDCISRIVEKDLETKFPDTGKEQEFKMVKEIAQTEYDVLTGV